MMERLKSEKDDWDTRNWIQKYQPNSLSEVVGQDLVIHRLQTKVKIKQISHYCFLGSAGVGKTSTAYALAKDIFGDNWQMNFYVRNASDDRGIGFVRGWIKEKVNTAPVEAPFIIIFLDEVDALTSDAQAALRETMMKHTDTCKFILSGNYGEKIIEPILDRCQVFRFRRIEESILKNQVEKISAGEGIPITPDNATQIAKLSQGSMRKSLNCLETLYGETKIDSAMIESLFGTINPDYSKELMKLAMSGNIEATEKYLYELYYNKGFEVREIMTGMMDSTWNSSLPIEIKTELVVLIGKYDRELQNCGNQLIQMRCLLWDLRSIKV